MQQADEGEDPKVLEAADTHAEGGTSGPATAQGSGQTANAEEQQLRMFIQMSQDLTHSPEELAAAAPERKKSIRAVNFLLRHAAGLKQASAQIERWLNMLTDVHSVIKPIPELILGYGREVSLLRQQVQQLCNDLQTMDGSKVSADALRDAVADVQRRVDKWAHITALAARKGDDIVAGFRQVVADGVLIADIRLSDMFRLSREQMPPLEQTMVEVTEPAAMEVSDGQPAGDTLAAEQREATQGMANHDAAQPREAARGMVNYGATHPMQPEPNATPSTARSTPPLPGGPPPPGYVWGLVNNIWAAVPDPTAGRNDYQPQGNNRHGNNNRKRTNETGGGGYHKAQRKDNPNGNSNGGPNSGPSGPCNYCFTVLGRPVSHANPNTAKCTNAVAALEKLLEQERSKKARPAN